MRVSCALAGMTLESKAHPVSCMQPFCLCLATCTGALVAPWVRIDREGNSSVLHEGRVKLIMELGIQVCMPAVSGVLGTQAAVFTCAPHSEDKHGALRQTPFLGGLPRAWQALGAGQQGSSWRCTAHPESRHKVFAALSTVGWLRQWSEDSERCTARLFLRAEGGS